MSFSSSPKVPPEFDKTHDLTAVISEREWVATQLEWCKSRYTEIQELRIALCSWNVDQKKPPSDLKDWIHSTRDPPPHIIVVGLQEVDMSAQAMLTEETEAYIPWRDQVRSDLKATTDKNAKCTTYCEAVHKQLVGLYLAVYIHHSILNVIEYHGVVTESVGAMGGSFGNKGGIGFSFKVWDSYICIINAHLAAHMGAVEKRNKDAANVISKLNCAKGLPSGKSWPSQPKDHDVILFFGDLNYRITGLSNERVRAIIQEGKWADLLPFDQLHQQLETEGTVWWGWKAGDVRRFPPTYKYNPRTNEYDSSEKRRVPAWTDRVLWWCTAYDKYEVDDSNDMVLLKKEDFNHFEHHNISDHKPITAYLTCKAEKVLPKEREKVKAEAVEQVKIADPDTALKYKLSPTDGQLKFGTVELGRPETRTLTLENTGEGLVQYQISADTSPNPSIPRHWLRVNPVRALLQPGQKSDITVAVEFDHSIVDACFLEHRTQILRSKEKNANSSSTPATANSNNSNSSPNWLNDDPFDILLEPFEFSVSINLVLQLKCIPATRCAMVQVTAKYRPSCFGTSLQNMINCGSIPIQQYYKNGGTLAESPDTNSASADMVPKELWYMLDHIAGNSSTEELTDYTSPKWVLADTNNEVENVQAIKYHLDSNNGKISDSFPVHCVGSTLLEWFQKLDEPLIPYSLYSSALESATLPNATAIATARSEVINVLPNVNYNVFWYMISFLQFWLLAVHGAEKGSDSLTADVLVQAFANAMLRPPPPKHPAASTSEPINPHDETKAKIKFLLLFVEA